MKFNFNELFHYLGLITKENNIYKVINCSPKNHDDLLNNEIILQSNPLHLYLNTIDASTRNSIQDINDRTYFCIRYQNNYFLFFIDNDIKQDLYKRLELGQKLLNHKSVILFMGEVSELSSKIKITNIDNNVNKIIDKDLILNKHLDEVFEIKDSLYIYNKHYFYVQTIYIGNNQVIGCLININEKEFFKDIDYITFRNILDNLNESIIILDTQHDVIYANTKSHLLFRKNLVEIKHDWDYINCVDENKNSIPFEHRLYRKALENKRDILNRTLGYRLGENGDIIWLLCSSRIIYDESNEIKGTINSYLDITKDKQHTDEAKELLVKLESHNANIPLSLVEFDENLDIQVWNWKAEDLFKSKARDMMGKNLNDLNIIHEDDYYYFYESFEDLLKGKELKNIIEVRNYNKYREIIYCTWFNSIININNKKSIFSYVLDTTHEKQLLIKNQETEDRLKTILSLLPNKNEKNSEIVSTKLVENLINNPLTENANEKSIKAEILLRLLEEEIKKINTTLYHNGKAIVTRVAVVEQNQSEDRNEFVKLYSKLGSVENKIEGLGNILNWSKLLNKQSLIWIVIIIAFGSATFESILLPSLKSIRSYMSDKIELVLPEDKKEEK